MAAEPDRAMRAGSSPSLLVRDVFFDEAHIERTAELCVRSLSDCTDDPLTVFGNVAIRTAVSCNFTQDGLLPFNSDLRVRIPFSSMTVAQLHVVRSIAASTPSANTIRYKHLNGTLSVSCLGDGSKVFADAALVLFAINTLILRAVEGRTIDVGTVINVTQQRVLASINVHRSQLARADSLTRAYIAARQDLEQTASDHQPHKHA
jgi:hypothetical protein